VPTAEDRSARLEQVRQWMTNANADPLWESDEKDGDVPVASSLSIALPLARLGFPDFTPPSTTNGATSLKDGLLEGTAWVLRRS